MLLLLFSFACLLISTSTATPLTPTSCLSHNDCSHLQDGTHACFFNTQEATGFCFQKQKLTTSFIELNADNTTAVSNNTVAPAAAKDVPMPAMQPADPATEPEFGDGSLLLHGDTNQAATLSISSGKNRYSLSNDAGTFAVEHASKGKVLSAKSNGDVLFAVPSVHARSISSKKSLLIDGFNQWRVVVRDEYDGESPSGLQGWKSIPLPVASGLEPPNLPIGISTECNVAMLGGPGIFQNAGSIKKEFTFQDPSIKHVRILSNFHFIDNWSGQSGFMKVASLNPSEAMDETEYTTPGVVWARQYSITPRGPDSMTKTKMASLNVCGNPEIGEHLFANKIDVVVPVVRGKIQLIFGSTWELQNTGKIPCSWGISGLKFLVR